MTLFLQIVAGFVVAIILVGLAVYFWIRRKLKGFGGKLIQQLAEQIEQAAMGGAVPPFRLHLRTVSDGQVEFNNDEDVRTLTEEFLAAGFETICDFETVEIPLPLRAFRHVQHNAYGVIYDHPVAGVFCDVTRRYKDRRSWTVSSSSPHGMDPIPGSHPTFLPGAAVEELLNHLLEASPVNEMEEATREDFVVRFESAYAREMNYRIERQGPTEQEIRRIAEMNGQECDQQQIDAVQKQWKSAISEFLSEKAVAMWKKEQDVPPPVFARLQPQLVAIHDRMLPDELMNLVFEDFDLDDIEDEELDDTTTRRMRTVWNQLQDWLRSNSFAEAFVQLLKTSGQSSKWQHQGSVSRPIPAEIWLRPSEDEEDQEDEHDDSEYDEELEV